jgi:hypothetical protein
MFLLQATCAITATSVVVVDTIVLVLGMMTPNFNANSHGLPAPAFTVSPQLGGGLRMSGVMYRGTAMQQPNVPSYHTVQPEYPRAVGAPVY